MARLDPIFPNATIVARREYSERVRSRLFAVSTILLASLAVFVALLPLAVRIVERGTVTKIGVAASDAQLARTAEGYIETIMNSGFGAQPGATSYEVSISPSAFEGSMAVVEGELDALVVATRRPDGSMGFELQTGETLSQDRLIGIQVAMFGMAVLDWVTTSGEGGGFVTPSFDVRAAAGPTAGGAPASTLEFATRRIVGAVFGFLIFITVVIYGMWVAAGVVAEKSSRVMELLISGASARQLVIGKIIGIGLAGLTQVVIVIVPALAVLLLEDRIAQLILGPGESVTPSLSGLSPVLLLGFGAFFVLGFALYAAIYAGVGSLVSRPEDLQVIALPLSLIAIAGYSQAMLALTGGTAGFIRIASFVPFWSPFVMLTRLSVGRVSALELVISLVILALTVVIAIVFAIRLYRAGVLLYGQRPGVRMFAAALRRG